MKDRFSWQITLLPIVFIIFTAGLFSLLNVLELQQDKKKQIETATSTFISQQKKIAKNRVMTALELIRFQSGRTEDLVRKRVKERVDEVIHIANTFYEKYHATLPDHQLKAQIKLLLSNAVFDHPDGYFFVVDMNTEKIIIHKLDTLVGYSMSKHKDLRGKPVLTEQKELLAHSDGAFQTIYFSKPTEPDKEFPKQLYVRYFKPFNWLIGTGEYLDDMETRLKAIVLKRLETLYTGENEDLFVHKIDNLEGRDEKPFGEVLISGNPIDPPGQLLFSTTQDSRGVYFRKEILQLLRNRGEGFVDYWHPSPKHGHEVQKTSFFSYDKSWNWAIGSGFYYDALDEQLAEIEANIGDKISKEIWTSLAITLLIAVGMASIFFVISRRISRTISRYSMQLQQAQKMESVGRLAGGVAHDFNNMLGVILGYCDLLLIKLTPKDSVYKSVREIRNAAMRSAEITRQLLAFSRQQEAAPMALDVNDSVEQLVSMIKRLIGEDITLDWHPGSDLWPIFMDSSQFSQIIMNLCVNAGDAIEETGLISMESHNIELDRLNFQGEADFTPGEYVMLSISDTGSGMDRHTMDKLFEPFFTTKKMGKGTGLGLATVYGILRQNNSFINVYSEPGKGSTFNIYFPRYKGDAEPAGQQKVPKQDVFGSETILLLEDEEALLSMATLMLQELGYTVLPCNSPESALRAIDETGCDIDLLITDVVMPEMNGREVSKILQERCPTLRTLFMSGYTANVIARRGVLREGVSFIQKPFSKQDLGLKVREVLTEHMGQPETAGE